MRSAANALRDQAEEVEASLRRALNAREQLIRETDENEARITSLSAASIEYRAAADRLDES